MPIRSALGSLAITMGALLAAPVAMARPVVVINPVVVAPGGPHHYYRHHHRYDHRHYHRHYRYR